MRGWLPDGLAGTGRPDLSPAAGPGRISTGPRTPAQIGVTAVAAPSGELCGPDRAQERVVGVDLAERLAAHVAEGQREEARWEDIPVVADEDDALAVPGGGRVRPRRPGRRRQVAAQFGRQRLVERPVRRWRPVPAGRDHPAEERCLHRPHHEAMLGCVVEEVADIVVLGRCDRAHGSPAAGLHQEEDLPGMHAEAVQQHRDPRQPSRVGRHDGGVDLHVQARRHERFDGRQGVAEMPGNAADPVVDAGGGAVQADRDRPDSRVRDPGDHRRAEQRGHRRREGDRDAGGPRVADQLEQVGPQQAVTAGENQDRVGPPELGHLADQGVAFCPAELAGQRLPLRGRPAVTAGEPARPGGLPEHEHGAAGEIGVRPGGGRGGGSHGGGGGHGSLLSGPAGDRAGRRQARLFRDGASGRGHRERAEGPAGSPRGQPGKAARRGRPGQAGPVRLAGRPGRSRAGPASAGPAAGHRRRCSGVPAGPAHGRRPRSAARRR